MEEYIISFLIQFILYYARSRFNRDEHSDELFIHSNILDIIEKCQNLTEGSHGTFSSGNTAPVTSFATQVSALLLLRFFSCSKAASLRCLTKGLFSYYSTNFYKEKERRVYHELENRAELLSKNSILLKKWWTVDITKFGGCLKSLENTYLEIDTGMEL